MNVSAKNFLLNTNFIQTAICKISFHRFYRHYYAKVECFNELMTQLSHIMISYWFLHMIPCGIN